MLTKVEGFILNETSYGETSKIINVLTKDHGVIGMMCKGAKSMKSPLRASTQSFTYGIFNIYYKENKLSTLVSVDPITNFTNIRQDLTLISFVTYLSELTSQVIKESDTSKIYDDFINTILKIEEGLDPLILTNILELKYLPLLGVGLDLDGCVRCGKSTDIVTIDASYGGLICKNCYQNERILDLKIVKLLRMYYYVDIKSISTINVEKKYKDLINKFINDYYESFTGLYLNSKKFLESIL